MKAYKPKTNIDDFINESELNSRIYQILLYLEDSEENGREKLKTEPLEIFNQVYAICHELKAEKRPEEKVESVWGKIQEKFPPNETSIIFSCAYFVLYFTESEHPHMKYFLKRIVLRIDSVYFQEFEPLLRADTANITALPANFAFVKAEADKIEDLNQRKLFYANYLTHQKQVQNKEDILKQISSEVDLIELTQGLLNVEKTEVSFSVQQKEDNYVRFMREVEQYKFSELPKYKALSTKNQMRLISQILESSIPQAVAMLSFLEFPNHLKTMFSMNKEKQYHHIAKSLKASVRSVKGNFLVLDPESNEDRFKYTANEHEEKVRDLYISLLDNSR
jgi:hypothetical protein